MKRPTLTTWIVVGLVGGLAFGLAARYLLADWFNEAGQRVLSYKVYRCWVSEYAVATRSWTPTPMLRL